jgi:hypothetical protein
MIVKVHQDPPGALIQDPAALMQYKSLVGALLHIANHTRPDVAFAVSYLARFSAAPTTSKFARLRDVLLYLHGTVSYGLLLGGGSCALHAFCDSDYAACTLSRRSTTGFLIKCGVGSISWKSARQPTVSRSTTEAEYIAAGEVAKEIQYVHQIAREFHLKPKCIEVGIDNRAALFLISDPISAARTKHIDIIHHHVREKVMCKQMKFVAVATSENPADVFTKPLPKEVFERHRSTIGIVP